jgi:tRNA(His) 5'-end guanylyltransferase
MTANKDSMGTRMKFYESFETERRLMPLLPVYCRVDGICFHSFCRKLKRPYDERLSALMIQLTIELAKEFNVNAAYTQSDEISLGWNIEDHESEMFCNGRILKLNSHLASKTSVKFNRLLPDFLPEKVKDEAYFDARVMNLPNTVEAANMFLWREFDATRNSIQMAGRAYFSHKQLHGKNGSVIQEMLFQEKKINWNDYPAFFRRGTFILRRKVKQPPDLSKVPEKYRNTVDPNILIEKSEFIKYDMPPFTKVANRDRVLFFGEEPVLSQAIPA